MSYTIQWDEKAREFLRGIPKEEAQRIIKRIDLAKDFPEHYFESLEEIQAHKLRVGDYRIIVDLDKTNQIIYIRFIGHRKNIYDKF